MRRRAILARKAFEIKESEKAAKERDERIEAHYKKPIEEIHGEIEEKIAQSLDKNIEEKKNPLKKRGRPPKNSVVKDSSNVEDEKGHLLDGDICGAFSAD